MKHESPIERAVGDVAANLVLDLDQTLVSRDARTIAIATRALGATSIAYSHQSLATQPLLAIPDVVAWCLARGGWWRRRVGSVSVTAACIYMTHHVVS
jgi:hypothetical protein